MIEYEEISIEVTQPSVRYLWIEIRDTGTNIGIKVPNDAAKELADLIYAMIEAPQ